MPPQQQAQRYAVQRHTRGWVFGILLAVMLPMIIIGVIVANAISNARRMSQIAKIQIDLKTGGVFGNNNVTIKTGRPGDRGPTWQGTDSMLVVDVDGDGTPEIVGRGRQVNAGDIVRVIALDLMTGKIKWQTDPIGTYSETYQGPLATGGDMVLFASAKAEVQAFGLRDGKLRWKAKLDERVASFCVGDDNTVIAVGADDVLRTLSRADGTAVGPAKPTPNKGKPRWEKVAPCVAMQDDKEPLYERLKDSQRSSRDRSKTHPKDLSVDVAMDAPGGGKVLSASKKEGTHVTTIVALDDKGAERWRATGAADALSAEGAPRQMVVGEKEVCIVYYSTDYRIACFAMADGKRLWDEKAPSFANGLMIVGRSLVLTTSNGLRVMNVETGAARWALE